MLFILADFRAYSSAAPLADLVSDARIGDFCILSEQKGLGENDGEHQISLERQIEPLNGR